MSGWWKLSLLASIALLSGCSFLIDSRIDSNFSDTKTRAFLKCAFKEDIGCDAAKRISVAQINKASKDKHSPLLWYLKQDKGTNFEVVEAFLKRGADPHNGGGLLSPYYNAIKHKNIRLLKLFSKYGAGPNHEYNSGIWTYPLHMAITYRHIDVVKFLLDEGADLESKDHSGQTPLLSARLNQYEIAILLLKRGASIDVIDKNGQDVCWMLRSPIDQKSGGYKYKVRFMSLLSAKGKAC